VLGATQVTSDTAGLASAVSWTLDSLVGPNSVTVTAGALSAVTFMATSVAGPPAKLAYIRQPTHALAGNPMDTVRVAIKDQYGNLVLSAKDAVSLQLVPSPPATLVGTVPVPAVNGVATFTDLVIDLQGTGYTLMATALNRTGAPSQPFDVGGVIKEVPVTRGPLGAAFDAQTKKLYVPGVAAVSVVLDDREVTQIPGFESPFGLAANPTTHQIYVSSLAGLVVIDGSRTPDAIRLTIQVGTGANGVAVDEQTNFIYVAATDPQKGGPALVPVDGSKDVVVLSDVVALPAAGAGVAFNPSNGLVYVVIPARQSLLIIDPKPGGASVVGEIFGMGKGASSVAIDAARNIAYVTNRDERSVSVVDLVKRTEQRLAVGDGPEGVAVDPDRKVVYVANQTAGTLSLIDAGTTTVFATLVVGPTPKTAAVGPGSGRVYVPMQQIDVVRVIQP